MRSSSIKTKQYWKQKIKSQINRKILKKEIFGEHYNHEAIKMNRNKKYFNEQVKIMQIQRSNRILLQKIKKIASRSNPKSKNHTLKFITQHQPSLITYQNHQFNIERSNTEHQIKNSKYKRQRYQSVQTILQNARHKTQLSQRLNDEEQTHKIVIYRGRKKIDGIIFNISIFIEKMLYNIISETKNSKQKIQIPLNSYKILLKQQLNKDHLNIFKMLKVNQMNKLSFVGSKKIQVDVVEKEELVLPPINEKESTARTSQLHQQL